MWQLGCWDINPPGDVLSLRPVARGTFFPLPVATDLIFTHGLAASPQLSFLDSLSLPMTPWALSHDLSDS